MIKELNIRNFRGINELKIKDLKKVNLFVGKNNSGKSTILEAIFLNIGAMNPVLASKINLFRNHDKINDNTYRAYFNNFNTNSPIKIDAIVKKPNQYRNLQIAPIYTDLENSTILDLNEIHTDENSAFYSSDIKGLDNNLSFRKTLKSKSKIYKSKIITGNEIKVTPPENYNEELYGIFIPPRKYLQDNVGRLEALKIRKEEDILIEILKEIEPNLQGLEILADNLITADIGKKHLIPVSLMGDGFNRMMAIILAIYNKKGGYILIDEIDNGLHHETLSILWKAMFKAVEVSNVQIFATTHSWENIVKFNEVAINENYENAMLYRIEHKDNNNNIVSYEQEVLMHTLENNWELR